jgi:L-galactono-1,4-lactone dehydrogenase
MWIPYEDAVVVVTNDPFDASVDPLPQAPLSPKDPLAPFRDLLKSHPNKVQTLDQIDGMGMGELRDSLLDLDPLSTEWVKKVNAAEHKFWKNACGYRYLPSDQLLQFECGGQQHVQEVCFPTGSLYNPSNADMDFMTRLLAKIEQGERERSITRRIKLNKCSFLQALSFISPPPLRSSQTPSPPPLQ